MKPLTAEEVVQLIRLVRDKIYSTLRKAIIQRRIQQLLKLAREQRAHEDAFVYEQLWHHVLSELEREYGPVFEQVKQFFEGNGKNRLRFPHTKEVTISKTRVRITVTHRGQAERVFGVDTLFEIEGEKVAALQHKKADAKHTFEIDEKQRQKLMRVCPTCPYGVSRRQRVTTLQVGPIVLSETSTVPFTTSYVQPGCSALYVMVSPEQEQQGVVSACRVAEFIHRQREDSREIMKLIDTQTFDEAFVKCLIGYDLRGDVGSGPLENQFDTLLVDEHLIFQVSIGGENERGAK